MNKEEKRQLLRETMLDLMEEYNYNKSIIFKKYWIKDYWINRILSKDLVNTEKTIHKYLKMLWVKVEGQGCISYSFLQTEWIRNTNIESFKNTPIYNTLKERKTLCLWLKPVLSEEEKKALKHLNFKIKEYFNL